jgi:hypothetical protein
MNTPPKKKKKKKSKTPKTPPINNGTSRYILYRGVLKNLDTILEIGKDDSPSPQQKRVLWGKIKNKKDNAGILYNKINDQTSINHDKDTSIRNLLKDNDFLNIIVNVFKDTKPIYKSKVEELINSRIVAKEVLKVDSDSKITPRQIRTLTNTIELSTKKQDIQILAAYLAITSGGKHINAGLFDNLINNSSKLSRKDIIETVVRFSLSNNVDSEYTFKLLRHDLTNLDYGFMYADILKNKRTLVNLPKLSIDDEKYKIIEFNAKNASNGLIDTTVADLLEKNVDFTNLSKGEALEMIELAITDETLAITHLNDIKEDNEFILNEDETLRIDENIKLNDNELILKKQSERQESKELRDNKVKEDLEKANNAIDEIKDAQEFKKEVEEFLPKPKKVLLWRPSVLKLNDEDTAKMLEQPKESELDVKLFNAFDDERNTDDTHDSENPMFGMQEQDHKLKYDKSINAHIANPLDFDPSSNLVIDDINLNNNISIEKNNNNKIIEDIQSRDTENIFKRKYTFKYIRSLRGQLSKSTSHISNSLDITTEPSNGKSFVIQNSLSSNRSFFGDSKNFSNPIFENSPVFYNKIYT